MVGGTTSGYSLIGSRNIASKPTMKITVESTPAKIGRRMKKWEKFIALWVPVVLCRPYLKIPNSKFQTPKKSQGRNSQTTPVRWGCLRLAIGHFSEAVRFGYGAFSFQAFRVAVALLCFSASRR